ADPPRFMLQPLKHCPSRSPKSRPKRIFRLLPVPEPKSIADARGSSSPAVTSCVPNWLDHLLTKFSIERVSISTLLLKESRFSRKPSIAACSRIPPIVAAQFSYPGSSLWDKGLPAQTQL